MTDHTAVVSGESTITARGPVREAAERMLGRLWIDQIPVRLASEDATLWPSTATAAAEGAELCWPGQPGPSRRLADRIGALRAAASAEGLTEVVMLGGGPPARAAELIARYYTDPPGGSLTVLDSLDPGPLLRAAGDPDRLRRTVVVVAGEDRAGDVLRRILVQLFGELGLADEEIARRFVVVTHPGGVAAMKAADAGHPLIEAPLVTSFGALSPYALVPAALAGADVSVPLAEAREVLPSLTRPENNPGLVLGALLGGAARAGRDTVVLGGFPGPDAARPGPALADWIAPLLHGATGGRLLPLPQHGGLPLIPSDDMFLVTLGGRPHQDDATVSGPPAAQLVLWEYAAAVAGHLLEADPMRPGRPGNGEGARGGGEDVPVLADGDPGEEIEVHAPPGTDLPAADLPGILEALVLEAAEPGAHLAIVAHLDPDPGSGQGTQVRRLAAALAARCGRPVPVQWGGRRPAYGNDHQERGVYLMLTGNVVHDVPVPGRHHLLGASQTARASGEVRAARDGGRPVVRLHLRDRRAGLARLLDHARGGP